MVHQRIARIVACRLQSKCYTSPCIECNVLTVEQLQQSPKDPLCDFSPCSRDLEQQLHNLNIILVDDNFDCNTDFSPILVLIAATTRSHVRSYTLRHLLVWSVPLALITRQSCDIGHQEAKPDAVF